MADLSLLPRITRNWTGEGIRLVSCRVPVDWAEGMKALVNAGFRQMEILVTQERDPTTPPSRPKKVRHHAPDDRNACVGIAARAFSRDRYHLETLIGDQAADRLKAQWVANGFNERSDSILVVDEGYGPIGFALGLIREGVAVLDLIAVKPESRKRGLGTALLDGFLAHYRGMTARAGTQENNYAALRLYENAGFRVVARAATFHWTPPT
ncbi:MAG: GNAT family N-acetyltransferase [Alphaproteobacteria bacterium]